MYESESRVQIQFLKCINRLCRVDPESCESFERLANNITDLFTMNPYFSSNLHQIGGSLYNGDLMGMGMSGGNDMGIMGGEFYDENGKLVKGEELNQFSNSAEAMGFGGNGWYLFFYFVKIFIL